MLHHLEKLAHDLGIDVRYEAAAGRVGMGRLRDRRLAVIDANLRMKDRIAALSTILAGEDTSEVFVPPAVRRRIDGSSPLRVRPELAAEEKREEETREIESGAAADAHTSPEKPNCDDADH